MQQHLNGAPEPPRQCRARPTGPPRAQGHALDAQPQPKTSATDTTMLTTFWKMATSMGMRVFCMPKNQPLSA
jgi:hypothetical protein